MTILFEWRHSMAGAHPLKFSSTPTLACGYHFFIHHENGNEWQGKSREKTRFNLKKVHLIIKLQPYFRA